MLELYQYITQKLSQHPKYYKQRVIAKFCALNLITVVLCGSQSIVSETKMETERRIVQLKSPPLHVDSDRVGWMRQALSGSNIGPFLLLDHWGGTYGPREAVSGSDHPHRGQETVSYILEGGIHHEDSAGNQGSLEAGWVQWMTAGSGVMHSEMHSDDLWENGGRCEGFQIWVNLLQKDKRVPPSYQDTPASSIPVITTPNGKVTVKIIAGESLGTSAVISTRIPMLLLDITLAKDASFTQHIPSCYEAFGYVFRGTGAVGGKDGKQVPVNNGQMFVLSDKGSQVTVHGGSSDKDLFRLLLFGGAFPADEPIVWHGPFVMNTQAEIQEAFQDYQSGKFGVIPRKDLRDAKRREAKQNISRRLAAASTSNDADEL